MTVEFSGFDGDIAALRQELEQRQRELREAKEAFAEARNDLWRKRIALSDVRIRLSGCQQ